MSRTTALLFALLLISKPAAGGQLGPPGQSISINITTATTTQLVIPWFDPDLRDRMGRARKFGERVCTRIWNKDHEPLRHRHESADRRL
jgi:hypothetical protein